MGKLCHLVILGIECKSNEEYMYNNGVGLEYSSGSGLSFRAKRLL